MDEPHDSDNEEIPVIKTGTGRGRKRKAAGDTGVSTQMLNTS